MPPAGTLVNTLRGGLALTASAVVAGLAVLLPLPELVRIPAALWLLGVLPGWVVLRAFPAGADRSLESQVLGALAASLPLGMLLATAGMWRPLDPAVFVASVAILLIAVARLRPRGAGAIPRPPADRAAWVIAFGTGLVCALPLALNPNIRVYGDAMFHGQIVNEILVHGLPPQDPSFAGQSLAYAWPLHAWVAALAHVADVTPWALTPWLAFGAGLALALACLRVARASGATPAAARLSVVVMLTAMNAFGALQAAVRYGVAPYLGSDKGGPGLADWLALCFDRPDAGAVAGSLVFHGHYVLSSLLYKFVCVNAVAAALVLAATAYAAALTALRDRDPRAMALAGLCTAGAALAHPVVGSSAAAALVFGLTCALASPVQRLRGLATLLAVAWGGSLALPLLLRMLAAPLAGGAHTVLRPYAGNAFALVQVLVVTAPLSVLAFRRAWRDEPRVAALAAGHATVALAISLVARFPSDAYAYPVYLAYLGTAWLVPYAVSELRERAARAPWLAAAGRVALVLLPLTTLLVVQGFARHDSRWGLAGWPATADERAVFDALRRTPPEALVIDTQNFQMSAAAAYSARRSVFGGMLQVGLVGYPAAPMRARERAIRELMYAPVTSDSAWHSLDALGQPLYVVARRSPSLGRVFDDFEQPPGDPVAKLDTLRERLEPVVHTPSIALYRYRTPDGH